MVTSIGSSLYTVTRLQHVAIGARLQQGVTLTELQQGVTATCRYSNVSGLVVQHPASSNAAGNPISDFIKLPLCCVYTLIVVYLHKNASVKVNFFGRFLGVTSTLTT